MRWYQESTEEVMRSLKTEVEGLNREERSNRLKENGPNQID
ncbi:hypothetical protein EVI01_20450 [Enterococcus villorum]|uniref:Cation-transporting P-type ATPase N-terminal domain-containing protein n=2 Tax=Enterococcus villorum TaxID=112904 RepID=A0A511J3W6_9ENTE|nr:hypothetical protein UAO_00236 [Enterococcus villorum ATCC 700913]EOW75458.1 hypothetical protein I591_02547 [Enterococcus villorum ATCC 700913]GEL92708.1 hypothetical protein EVI01_20450 [Enterococcus villorum]